MFSKLLECQKGWKWQPRSHMTHIGVPTVTVNPYDTCMCNRSTHVSYISTNTRQSDLPVKMRSTNHFSQFHWILHLTLNSKVIIKKTKATIIPVYLYYVLRNIMFCKLTSTKREWCKQVYRTVCVPDKCVPLHRKNIYVTHICKYTRFTCAWYEHIQWYLRVHKSSLLFYLFCRISKEAMNSENMNRVFL